MQLQRNFVFIVVYINTIFWNWFGIFSAKFLAKKEQFIVDLLHEQFFKCILFEKAKDNCKIIHFSLKHVFWSNIDKCLVIVAQNKRELTFYNSLAWLIRPISYQEPVISMLYFFRGKNLLYFFIVMNKHAIEISQLYRLIIFKQENWRCGTSLMSTGPGVLA